MKKQTIPQDKKTHITTRLENTLIKDIEKQASHEGVGDRTTMIVMLLKRALTAEKRKKNHWSQGG